MLGTGTMGSQIAAHLANCGCTCLLFGVSPEEDKFYTAAASIQRLHKLKPPALVGKGFAEAIQPCDYTNDLERLKECSLVIEAISEDINIKKQVYAKVVPHIHQDAIFASNTSGIKLADLGAELPPDLRPRFCGVHFFNPPRYMPLVELIKHPETKDENLLQLEGFLATTLGKTPVYAKDSPGFIANRIGIFSMAAVFYWMEKYKLAPDTVDLLCGGMINRAKSACFRTADIVGLDILEKVMENLRTNLGPGKDGGAGADQWHKYFVFPQWLEDIIAAGHLGQKSGKGVYEKTAKGILVFDPAKGEYRPSEKKKSKAVKEIFANSKGLADALPKLAEDSDPQARFIWAVHREVFHYAAAHLEDIADNARDLDQAMMSGFGWEKGVFRLWQDCGIGTITKLIDKDLDAGETMAKVELPGWARQDIYTAKGAYSPQRKAFAGPPSHPVYKRQQPAVASQLWPKQKATLPEVVFENESIRVLNLKDGVAALSFKTKMNTLSFELLQSCTKALDELEKDYAAVVIWQSDGPFCAGANLYQILAGARLGKLEHDGLVSKIKQTAFETLNPKLPALGKLPPINEVIRDLQNMYMRLKHSDMPVVAAVSGLALGGGCELLLHTDRVIAANDSFIGLVETGIGVLPAGAGTKEMARRADELSEGLDDWAIFLFLKKFYTNMAMAKVSGSASEAKDMGYLRDADKIIANPRELLHVAKKECLGLLDESYAPPPRRQNIRIGGRPAIANFLAHLTNMLEGKFISPHDYLCAGELARVLCGGDLDSDQRVSDEWILDLELAGFIKLLGTKLTQDRLEHVLKTGKPLRN